MYIDKQQNEDYLRVVGWMDYVYIDRLHVKYSDNIKHEYSGYVVDGSKWDPNQDLNVWPSIYENMTDKERGRFLFLQSSNELNRVQSWDWYFKTFKAETCYKALVVMLKEIE